MIPVLCGAFVFGYNTPALPHDPNVLNDIQAWLTLFSGIILGVSFWWAKLRDGHALLEAYSPKKNGTSLDVNRVFKENKTTGAISHAHRFILGFSSDTMGPRLFFKGFIPVMHVPCHYVLARCFFMFAVGLGIYNDQKQAVMFFLCVGLLPVVISFAAGCTSYYMIYDIMAWFYFYLFSYFIKAWVHYAPIEYEGGEEINWNLMTVAQSAACPGDCPITTFESSIRAVYGSAFAFSAFSLLVTLMTPDPFGRSIKESVVCGETEDEKVQRIMRKNAL